VHDGGLLNRADVHFDIQLGAVDLNSNLLAVYADPFAEGVAPHLATYDIDNLPVELARIPVGYGVSALALAPGGKTLVGVGGDFSADGKGSRVIGLWETRTGKLLHEIRR
jgi:hypothetical protein